MAQTDVSDFVEIILRNLGGFAGNLHDSPPEEVVYLVSIIPFLQIFNPFS